MLGIGAAAAVENQRRGGLFIDEQPQAFHISFYKDLLKLL